MIDKIDGLGNVRTTAPVKRAVRSGPSGDTSFARQLGETEEASAPGGISSASSISGILGVQEVEDALDHASKGKMRAEDILDRLEDLRIQLLSGGISREKLMQLSRIVTARRSQVKDPRLSEILDAIDLRAQVELAKYSD
ncbi:MAG: flagellar assembly protein FliX [Alphaproteobacteria bacterium]|nr:flagellar assembly protein FliX [Alphaproteobacteria bacterium]